MKAKLSELGRRERQIMEIVFRRGRATAGEVLADLPDPPSYSTVRSMLRLLEGNTLQVRAEAPSTFHPALALSQLLELLNAEENVEVAELVLRHLFEKELNFATGNVSKPPWETRSGSNASSGH